MAIEDLLAQHRYEVAKEFNDVDGKIRDGINEVVKEGLKGDYATQGMINGLERATSQQIDAFEDVTNNAFMTVARDTADIRAQIIAQQQQVVAGFAAAAKDAEINALKTQIELAKQSTYLSDKIDGQAERTRELIGKLNDDSLNRQLVERNTELVGALEGGRYWWGRHNDGQFNAVASQLNAFQSQLQETRQGMVNFGTMAGVGQSSTSNNVR
jgi:hypothetical protein